MHIKELCLIGLLTWCMLSTVCGPIRPVTASLPLPPDWDTLCPYTDFCTHKAAQPINLTRAQKPCCEPCSCEPDCGLRRNCCQYSMDRYRIDEKYYTTCTSLSTAVDMFGDLQPRRFYMTVDKCPNKTSCYNFKAARWGSMLPVSSLETGMIYLNKQCASCHNEHNVTEWDTEVNCEATDARIFFHVDGLTNALNGNPIEPAMCFLTFFPPKDADVEFQSCINNVDMLRSCFLSDTNTTHLSQLLPLCKSFNATFSNKRKGFANIYCFLCSAPDGPSRKDDICANEHPSRTENTPFSALIVPGVIQALERTYVGKKSDTGRDDFGGCLPHEVGERKTGKCRRLWCKIGQIDMADKCEYLGNEWKVGPFRSFIKLQAHRARDRIPVGELKILASYKGKHFKKNLPKWMRWLFYADPKNESFVPFLVLRIYHEKELMNPLKFLNEFRKSLEDIWSLRIGKKRYQMKASFNRYQEYFACDDDYFIYRSTHQWACQEDTGIEFDEIYRIRSSNFEEEFALIPLTKFFFCDQVALNYDEYIDHGHRIYFRVTDRFLTEFDFRRISNNVGCDSIIMCVSDFGNDFWKSRNLAAMPHSAVFENCIISVFAASLAYLLAY